MLVLSLKSKSPIPIEVEGITPDAICNKTRAELQQVPIFHGNRKLPLAEFFSVSGDASDRRMRMEGDLAGVHWIGAHMTAGEIHVAGNAGRHVGSEMRGGTITVEGNASDWVGGEMRGGRIHVRGRAGHLVGAAYRGSAIGMKGGTILIDGDAGNEIGHTMRRGLIAVGGNIGDLAAFNMRAGTILFFGESGIRHAAGMRRGTIVFFSDHRPDLLPTFRRACRYRPEVMPMILREVQRLDGRVPDELFGCEYDLFNGDLIEGGRGEVLFRA